MNKGLKLFSQIIRGLCLILSVVLTVSMLGCRQRTRESSQEEPIPSEPMLVFYEKDAGNILTNYQVAYPDVELKTYEIESNQDGLKNGIEKHGEPDLVLVEGARNAYLEEWYEQGIIADINELYLNDDSLNANDYFMGTFEVGKTEKGLLGLPLAISMRFATLREENYVGTAFENLKEGYTGEDLLEAIEKELDKPKGEKTFFSVESFGSPIEILYCLGAIKKEKEGAQIDEELFKEIYDICYRRQQKQEEVREYYNKIAAVGAFRDGYHFHSGMDPRIYNGEFLLSEWGHGLYGAPQMLLSYAKSANVHEYQQETEVIWYPSIEDGNKYGAEAKVFGLVGGRSNRQEEAYQVLRQMMDVEIEYCVQPGSAAAPTYSPVNRANAEKLVEKFNGAEEEIKVLDPIDRAAYKMEKKVLTEEEQEKVKEVMNRIGFMYRFDPILVEADSIYGRYYKAGITDYQGCYQEIMQLLNPESEEWQIESQNLTEGEKADSSIPETEVDEEERKELQERLKSAEIGDEVLLGRYEQDNNLENGSEEIEWIVLDKQDGKMLLLSKYCLDAMAYKDGDRFESLKRSNWLESTIYKWLHSELMEKGFDVEEQSIIMVSTIPIKIKVDKSESPENVFGIVTDGTAESRLFLLSLEELEKYLPEKEQRKAKATAYAMREEKSISEKGNYIQWWLRTRTNCVFNIKIDENGDTQSIFNMLGGIGVRPVMWVDIGEE